MDDYDLTSLVLVSLDEIMTMPCYATDCVSFLLTGDILESAAAHITAYVVGRCALYHGGITGSAVAMQQYPDFCVASLQF